MDGRVNQSDGAVIYTGDAAKILWRVPGRASGMSLQLTARRLDGPGAFVQRFPTAGGGDFPSIVDIPSAGCWA